MILTARLHRVIKQKVNKIDSNHYQDLTPDIIDDIIHESTLYLLSLYDYKGDDAQWVKEYLSPLVVSYPDQPAITGTPNTQSQIPFIDYDLSSVKYPVYRVLRAWVECGTVIRPVSIIGSDQQKKIDNAYVRPSRKWGRFVGMLIRGNTSLSGNFTSSVLRLYVDAQDLQDTSDNISLRIEYHKVPKKVFLGGYDSLEYVDCTRRQDQGHATEDCSQYYSLNSEPVQCELNENALDLLTDIAAYKISGMTENQLLLQIKAAEVRNRTQLS